MTNEIKEIIDKLEIVARKHTIEVCENGSKIETMPASVVDELRLNNYSAKILLDYITNLQNKYDKSLELLADFNMPCEYDESKISHNYCEEFCDTDDETYKKCWNKYIENILRGDE